MRGIYLLPVGEVEQSLLAELAKPLEDVFNRPCQVGQALPHPWPAYDSGRDQYRAQMVLDAITGLRSVLAERLLGVVDVDLYTPRLNFVFGLATMGGREAIIALPRLRQSFYSLPEDPALFRHRALKEAVHELTPTPMAFVTAPIPTALCTSPTTCLIPTRNHIAFPPAAPPIRPQSPEQTSGLSRDLGGLGVPFKLTVQRARGTIGPQPLRKQPVLSRRTGLKPAGRPGP